MSSQLTTIRLAKSRCLEQKLPPLLRPAILAYVLGYASSTAPRVLTLLLTYLNRKRKNIDEKPDDKFINALIQILRGGLEFQRFPTFCAALLPLQRFFASVVTKLSQAEKSRLAKWLSTFTAAWFSLKLLQSKKSNAFTEIVFHETANGRVARPTLFAGRTMDLTLFAVTRALDVVIGELWTQRRDRRKTTRRWSSIDKVISTLADPAIFASSCALIMWAWIYTPDRLPRSYNKWIKSAAAVDQRLLLSLRRMRYGEIKYGQETGQAYLLQDMCKDYNLPLDYGDPAKTVPYPCEIVHMGTGSSCEYHAFSRFVRSFTWAFSTYLPLNLILTARDPTRKRFVHALKSSARSSSFLGTFIALYYYGICLTRSRLGPRVLGSSTATCQQIDSGPCIGGGCALCGWSVLIETETRRKELGLFVAPRALATLLPRRYLMEKQWRETLAFATSAAVVFTCVSEKPERPAAKITTAGA
ncbi:related to integral membrane protein [Rhynchosporium agropyri]|uniref:Related to integral membrane protein n=1 Tax=Rhynchosporium agropyri TaxID=914238 RepID=A0A1E1KN13_9HELO|nr:related to integral membrane protein [Rhynchosporium agropyri]